MAFDTDRENVHVEEAQEYVDGGIRTTRTTVTTNVSEEVVPIEETDSHTSTKQDVDSVSSHEDVPYLVCHCQTPSGETTYCLIHDNHDGTYTIDVNAAGPGVHTVHVELGGKKIPGSPFLVRIVQAADKKKVLFYGNGLNAGLLEDVESIFFVDTKGAGPGDLKVRIHGPKDGFDVVLNRDHQDDRIVKIDYNPSISGIYTMNVFWSGEHVAGSPCEVFIAQDSDAFDRWRNDPQKIREEEGLSDKYHI